ncbi:site-2 protease family protein [Vitiosangium sp. GDMCC 1.1324]|uniref:site-2 protease family protein n=1 Tax=Vitiosangium sp. (strain GDMCC 1.1324) TaxID=2138576 RepID=UPI000D35EB37|nr:site-2 protease family protein [Vitiosangium sp. GDMCC 1.1324]PTL76582.1 site-2 protease family protein [Vitiosangium sp. GDMCC 1.1324]
MRGAFRIATLRGIPIRVHYSFLLVLPFLAYLFGQAFRSAAEAADVPPERLTGSPLLWGLGLAVALFLSVLVHELAHSFYALRKGGQVSDITLLMIGGVSRITRMPEGSRQEALMALAGPLTSLALGALFLGAYVGLAGARSFNLRFAVFYLGNLNVFLGLFNLLPAFPMDGGRVLRAVLTGRLGRVRATQVAGMVGKGFALLFGVVGLFGGNFILLLIAFFVFMGAEAESREVLMQSLLNRVHVRELMAPRTAAVEATDSLEEVATRMQAERRRALPVVEDGHVVGLVTLAAVRQVPAPRRSQVRVRAVALPVPLLTPESTAWEALREMGQRRLPQLPVVQEDMLVGTVTQDDVMRGLELRELEDTNLRGPWGLGPREHQSPT